MSNPAATPPKSGRKGRVTATRTVWCADCGNGYQAAEGAGATLAEREWMGLGWAWVGRLGWICPVCFKARADARAGGEG